MAARRLVNSEGPCEKEGDEFGNTFDQILSRYYAYSYQDVNVLKFEFALQPDHAIVLDGYALIEQILIQHKVDKSVLFSNYSHFGMGCNCKANPGNKPQVYAYNLYCVLAVA